MITDESTHTSTDIISSAIHFINTTSAHIFLTGKAGTGKTTFLKNLAERIHKQFAVVAPTGIAALNAGGVTIHSQFLLPFGMFIPDRNLANISYEGNFYTSDILARKHPMNSSRKQVLRSIDLLVIDEVSMLRADLLDAIDYRMKAAKGNFRQSFGGVQLLLIGDLYQLPPVVKREEENVLKRYYKSAWFYESTALRQSEFVYIELDKIFRQRDDAFITILNNLRNNQTTQQDIDELNKYYKTADEIQSISEVITLTTHNYKADELNSRALKELETQAHILHADITGDFPESMYPVLQHLELKVGAQIMFTKNDNDEKKYFNGKLATVKAIGGGDITVEMAGSHERYTLKKELWENKRYTVDTTDQEITDEIIGTFEQYPVKLAWAITIHKSQGLTFEKAIIDVGQAFADGQVYVALSRLRSLDGLILRTRINPNVISTDKEIVSFTSDNNQPDKLSETIKLKQHDYILQLIERTFDFGVLVKECQYIRRSNKDTVEFSDDAAKSIVEQITDNLLAEKDNTEKFKRQLRNILETNTEQLVERMKAGSQYYKSHLQIQVNALLLHTEETKRMKRMKTYLNNLVELDQLFSKKLEEVDKVMYLTESILNGVQQFDFSTLTEQRASTRSSILEDIKTKLGPLPTSGKKGKRKSGTRKKKKDERSTYDITLSYLEAGLSIEDIAKERELVVGTIEGHLAKAVEERRITIDTFMHDEDVTNISNAMKEMPKGYTSKDLFDKLNGKYGYGKLRAVMSHVRTNESPDETNLNL